MLAQARRVASRTAGTISCASWPSATAAGVPMAPRRSHHQHPARPAPFD